MKYLALAVSLTVVAGACLSLEVASAQERAQRPGQISAPMGLDKQQKHFILSSVPHTCPFCLFSGPQRIVWLQTTTPVKYTMRVVVVEGPCAVLGDDCVGLLDRITDATRV